MIKIVSAIAMCTLLASCASTPMEERDPLAFDPSDLIDSRFEAGAKLLSGIPESKPFDGWHAGDQILFGVMLHNRNGEQIRYIRINVCTGKPIKNTEVFTFPFADGSTVDLSSDDLEVSSEIFDDTGALLNNSTLRIRETFVRNGFFDFCATGSNGSIKEPFARGFVSLMSLFTVILQSPELYSIFKSVAKPPSLLSALIEGVNFGISFGDAGAEKLEPVEAFGRTLTSAYRVPVEIRFNRIPILDGALFVIPPDPPFHLCAGVPLLKTVHADDPTRWMIVRVLAIRYGS